MTEMENNLNANSCCEQPIDASACCTPISETTSSVASDDCCEQPIDGSACCTPASSQANGKSSLVRLDQAPQVSAPKAGSNSALPVAIIGGGPTGLAAAAHLTERGESFILFEAGDSVAAAIWSWRHVRLFSPWRYCTDKASVAVLERNGWQSPDLEAFPSGGDLVEQYLRPLAATPELAPFIHLNSRVTFVGRKGLDKMKTADRDERPFVLHIEHEGKTRRVEARAVMDASGTWDNPNPLGSGGVSAIGEKAARDHIMYGIPDVLGRHVDRYADKRVMVVGSGHSAMNAMLELAILKESRPATEIIWAIRKNHLHTVFGGGDADGLPERGALGARTKSLVESRAIKMLTPFFIHEIDMEAGKLNIHGTLGQMDTVVEGVDEIITATGARPDFSFLREVRFNADAALESVPALAPLIDPNIHSCGTVRPHGEAELRQAESDLYIVGMKSYGRAPTFLLATGYEQVRSVAAALVGDWEAAARVELDLPETGVCSTNLPADSAIGASCCGPEAVECATDIEAAPAIALPTLSAAESCCSPAAVTEKAAPAIALATVNDSSSCC